MKELVAHHTQGAPGVELREGGLDGALHPSTVVPLIHLQKQINKTIFIQVNLCPDPDRHVNWSSKRRNEQHIVWFHPNP